MLDFIYKLHENLPQWQVEKVLTLKQIASSTKTPFSNVLQFMSEGLKRELDSSSKLSKADIQKALLLLRVQMKPQIEERERLLAEQQRLVLNAYDRMMSRLAAMCMAKNWYMSFRSLSYFAGKHELNLPNSVFINLCSEIVRIGIKSGKANLQELGFWLTRGVTKVLLQKTPQDLEEAVDLVDCYLDFFLTLECRGGKDIVKNILDSLKQHAVSLGVLEHYIELVEPIMEKLNKGTALASKK